MFYSVQCDQLFIFFSGGYEYEAENAPLHGLLSDKILQYDQDTKTFNEAGKLKKTRRSHSMSVVETSDFNCS